MNLSKKEKEKGESPIGVVDHNLVGPSPINSGHMSLLHHQTNKIIILLGHPWACGSCGP